MDREGESQSPVESAKPENFWNTFRHVGLESKIFQNRWSCERDSSRASETPNKRKTLETMRKELVTAYRFLMTWAYLAFPLTLQTFPWLKPIKIWGNLPPEAWTKLWLARKKSSSVSLKFGATWCKWTRKSTLKCGKILVQQTRQFQILRWGTRNYLPQKFVLRIKFQTLMTCNLAKYPDLSLDVLKSISYRFWSHPATRTTSKDKLSLPSRPNNLT